MAISWVTTIGFVIVIAIAGWIFSHFIQEALNKNDSFTIDPLPDEEENTTNNS
ncbi:hypothetical protein [Bacillus dakarensis]|uniref:hypothetical protein n=1 Tax=Robertmurraya dakarensis TaxID=1926278 RepID=UPI0012B6A18C|nr:hypothetical protein [Bacillus dakarensis]